MNHTSSQTPRWVVLTGEQRDRLEQDVTVRGRRGPVLVEGPVDHVSEHGEVTIGHGRDGVMVTGPVEVRERDVPQLESSALDPTGWVDRHGDVWREGADGLMHTPETRPFPREHVEKKWGPLHPARDVTPEPDPRRLVSVRWDDLEALVASCDIDDRWNLRMVARIRAALRGETR